MLAQNTKPDSFPNQHVADGKCNLSPNTYLEPAI